MWFQLIKVAISLVNTYFPVIKTEYQISHFSTEVTIPVIHLDKGMSITTGVTAISTHNAYQYTYILHRML